MSKPNLMSTSLCETSIILSSELMTQNKLQDKAIMKKIDKTELPRIDRLKYALLEDGRQLRKLTPQKEAQHVSQHHRSEHKADGGEPKDRRRLQFATCKPRRCRWRGYWVVDRRLGG